MMFATNDDGGGGRPDSSDRRGMGASLPRSSAARRFLLAVALLLGLVVASRAHAYETPSRLNEVARAYSLGVGEVRCASAAEWQADGDARFRWGYTNVRADYTVLPPLICAGALNVADDDVPTWQRALGTLVLVHEAFHLRHWRFRRDEGKVECQAIVYFTDAARSSTSPTRPGNSGRARQRRTICTHTRSAGTGG